MSAAVEDQQILIVDDEERISDLLSRQLTLAGYEVTTANSASEALVRIEAAPPALVILDLRMPGMTGYELCTQLRSLYDRRKLRIVILTALERGIEELRCLAVGADVYLQKPYDAQQLVNIVHRLLGGISSVG